MSKLKIFIFEDASIEETMTISGGGASLASSGQIAGGPMLPIGMKPGQKAKRRKKGKLLSASPAVHNPDALALQEMPHVMYDKYEPVDFEVEKLDIPKEEKIKIFLAFRNTGVLCHSPEGDWLLCTLDDVRKATDEEIANETIPRLEVTLEHEHSVQESFGAMHKPKFKGPAMSGLWLGLENPDDSVKTDSLDLDNDY